MFVQIVFVEKHKTEFGISSLTISFLNIKKTPKNNPKNNRAKQFENKHIFMCFIWFLYGNHKNIDQPF